jgi:hypothetical protein
VVVFADSRTESASLPAGANQVRGAAGNVIPLAMVTNSDGSAGIRGISYTELKSDTRKAVRELKKLIEEKGGVEAAAGAASAAGAAGTAAKAGDPEKPKSETDALASAQEWTNVDGKKITAAVLKIMENNVEFMLPDGTTTLYPIDKLAEESRVRMGIKGPAVNPDDPGLPSILDR